MEKTLSIPNILFFKLTYIILFSFSNSLLNFSLSVDNNAFL